MAEAKPKFTITPEDIYKLQAQSGAEKSEPPAGTVQITPDDFKQFGNMQPQQNETLGNYGSKLYNNIKDTVMSSGIPHAIMGAMGSPYEIATNSVNATKDILSQDWMPQKFQQFAAGLEHHPEVPLPEGTSWQNLNAKFGRMGGNIALQMMLMRGLPLSPTASLPMYAARGAGVAGLTSSSDNPGGRMFASALGGVGDAASQLMPWVIGGKAMAMQRARQAMDQQNFGNLFTRAGEILPHDRVQIPPILTRQSDNNSLLARKLAEIGSSRQGSAGTGLNDFQSFVRNPTLEKAHWFDSSLKQLRRHTNQIMQTAQRRGQPIDPETSQLNHYLIQAGHYVNRNLHHALSAAREANLAPRYSNLIRDFEQNGLTFRTPEIMQGLRGHQSPLRVGTGLLRNNNFAENGGRLIPGYGTANFIRRRVLPLAGGTILTGLLHDQLGHTLGRLRRELL